MQTTIGLEIHAQLLTNTKLFCGCSADYFGRSANSLTCPVCLGMPGALPVLSREAVSLGIRVGLALGCEISETIRFDRKNYFYPDLPKGYQITQFDHPIARNGSLLTKVDGKQRKVRIRRVHIEEDAGKLTHCDDDGSLIDFNRSGIPLAEIVTEPDITSPAEARAFLRELRRILRYLGVCTGDMEEGALRCDANLSIGSTTCSGTKTEVKNMNSFRAVERALYYEESRQKELLKDSGRVEEITLGWDESRGRAVPMRSKEQAHDYRYFPEPDLPPVTISREWIESARRKIPELPNEKRIRFVKEYSLGTKEVATLTEERFLADYFERVAELSSDSRSAASWILSELLRLMKDVEDNEIPLAPGSLAEVINAVNSGKINRTTGKKVLEESFSTGKSPSSIIDELGLSLISDTEKLTEIISSVLSGNSDAVADYKAGKKAALGFLVGQVMKETKGQADPQQAQQILKRSLEQE